MPKLLVMVHNSFDAKMLPGFFKRILPENDVLSIPFSSNGPDVNSHIAQLPQDLDVIIVESNYGTPSCSDINETLLSRLLTSFPGAIIVATSSTVHSLDAAMKFDSRIMIMGKGNLKPEGCDLARVQSLTSLKVLLQPESKIGAIPTPSFELSKQSLAISVVPGNEESCSPKKKLTRTG